MKVIKISYIWWIGEGELVSHLICQLIKKLTNKEIIFVSPKDADILFIGPSSIESIPNRIINYLSRKLKLNSKIQKSIEYFRQSTLLRRYQPLKIFINYENYRYNNVEADFSISYDLGVTDPRHIRIPIWKQNIDWSRHQIYRDVHFSLNGKSYSNANILRFDSSYYNLDDLLKPQGSYFLNKKNICIFTSHMNEPRGTIYREFSKEFIVDGYGMFFDKNLLSHSHSSFSKKKIMQNYSFNLCPHNNNYPGIYEEKVPEAFLGKCLPITWADQNIDIDFNIKAFVNLNDHIKDNFKEIIYLLKQREFLEKFTYEPLLLSEPNLQKEEKFAKKIIDSL